ncbi:membrane protein [Bacteroidia bacterium]|nr:membrane protein [Bacteroidia bacterium]GHV71645.1 membrane protein [Bacteroidia bacterium]
MDKNNKDFRFKHQKARIRIIILSLIVLFPNIYLAFYNNEVTGATFGGITAYLALSVFLFILPSLFLKARVFFLIQGIFVILAPLEIAHIYMNRMPATSAFLLSIIDTEWNESTELLSSLKVPIFILLLLWILYFYITIKKINNHYFVHSKKIRAYISGAYLVAILVGYAYYFTREYSQTAYKIDIFKTTNEDVEAKFREIYPYDLIIRAYEVYDTKKQIKEGREKIKHFEFGAQKTEPVDGKEIYVFVIGETGRYNSYSINGYKRETAPLLSKTENLVSYSDFFSEANITSSSISTILTRATANDYNRSFVEKSFVDAFKEAGFKTYWIANQSASNKFIRRIAGDADGEYFTVTDMYADNYDEKLWPYLDEVLKKSEEKVFIVLHTLGSHFRYNFRYPPRFEVFRPSLQGAFDYAMISAKNKQQFINTYDNSILYTDYFLANTIRKIDSLQAVGAVIYMADHGENLFDTKENVVLHGGSKYTEYDFHVPFFVWTSDKYRVQYPSKTENIIRNKDKKLSSGNLFYSWLDIAGITFPEQIRSKSIASESLQEDSVRYIINTNMEVKEEARH